MKTVFWGNYKGGVGKTTSVFQIAGQFASAGKRVLLVDLDPQCSLSYICCSSNGNQILSDFKVEQTFNYLLEVYREFIKGNPQFKLELLTDTLVREIKPITRSLIMPLTDRCFKDNLFFIPSSISFENARINELVETMGRKQLNVCLIKLFIEDLEGHFDYVFFDCPPTTNILIQSVFLASDYYIVPTIIDEISAKGVPDYICEIEKTYGKYCMEQQVGGILMHKLFTKRAQFVGAFETLYKGRSGKGNNMSQIEQLDYNIRRLEGIHSLVSESENKIHRYNVLVDDFETKHIFKYYIRNRDNRSGGESIPKNTSEGCLTLEYVEIAEALLKMI
ncbi:ParA family protein [Niameybacter sp.]|uniref:ParA family protein n=3 Tax=Niameybacter sp. TaxID=2033640 RepID=UPI002FC9A9A3